MIATLSIELRSGMAWKESQVNLEDNPKFPTIGKSRYEISLLDLLIVLVQRRRFLLWFSASVAVLATIVVLLLPKKYTAETVLLPPEQSSSTSSALLNQFGGSSALASLAGSSLGIKNPGEMYAALFRSRTVEDSLIQQFGLMKRYHKKRLSKARKEFEDRSTVSVGAEDGLIRITVTDSDPKLAADIANGYVGNYRKLSSHLAISEAARRRVFFQQQLLEASKNLTDAEEKMKDTQEKTGVLSLDSQARSLIESAASLRAEVSAKEVELNAMRSYATPDNPEFVIAEQQLAGLKNQLAQLAGSKSKKTDILLTKGKIPQASMEYLNRLRDVRYYETIVELMAKEFEMAKLDEAREGANVQVVDVAVPPDTWSFPKRTLIVLLATIFGFFFACGTCLCTEAIQALQKDPVEGKRFEALRSAFYRRGHTS
ncbi:MAG TPA: GNVR domain-containing protein [Candidatus Acidoferrales bacterium]|nr:GNVR domain-containing protein [Candidatus Acidoferrales bacterium]